MWRTMFGRLAVRASSCHSGFHCVCEFHCCVHVLAHAFPVLQDESGTASEEDEPGSLPKTSPEVELGITEDGSCSSPVPDIQLHDRTIAEDLDRDKSLDSVFWLTA